MQQTDAASRQIEDILLKTPGVEYVTSIVGFNLLSSVQSTYTGFFFITLEEWSKRKTPELQVDAIRAHINRELARAAQADGLLCLSASGHSGRRNGRWRDVHS